jgi:hypothetical protein
MVQVYFLEVVSQTDVTTTPFFSALAAQHTAQNVASNQLEAQIVFICSPS